MIDSISQQCSCGAAAPAHDAAALVKKFFARLDRDGDGRLSAGEFTSAMQQRFGRDDSADASGDATSFAGVFQQVDTDGDGQINADEFKSGLRAVRDALRARAHARAEGGERRHGRPDPAELFAAADADGSGTVTAEELQTHFEQNVAAKHPNVPAPDFAQMITAGDQDGDGALNESEFTALRPSRPERRAGFGGIDVAALFRQVDGDDDGLITLEEFTAGFARQSTASTTTGSPSVAKLFASFDDDEDGKLSERELEAMLEQARRLFTRRGRVDRYGADGTAAADAGASAQLDATA